MKEVDVAVGPFGVSGVRAEVVDFTRPVLIDYSRILGARGQPEVNPWGFLFPLEPLVWAAIVAALLVLPTATILMSSCFSLSTHHQTYTFPATSAYLRLLLNQNVLECGGGWWWERVMLAVWGLVALVLTQSYAGNLMALLAVRYIPQPYQSLQDLVNDRSVKLIWEQGSSNAQIKREVATGIYRAIAELQDTGRLLYVPPWQYGEIIDTLVRRGDHVNFQTDSDIRIYMSRDFTASEQCAFYESKEEFEPLMLAMVSQKGNPIVSTMNKRYLLFLNPS
ncbi:glutamate receptor U1-like [Procambarus clarkii]|uniref:glutamate receptor U1-like n=1 Tax=Procambarus clarkii TaxID=6728 RepID=UPI003743A9A1